VELPPSDEPYIFFGEEVWFTETLIEELLRVIPDSGNGRLRCTDELWNEHSSSVFSTGDGFFRLGVCFGELPTDLSELPDLEIDFQLRDGDPIDLHPKMAHALRPMRVGAMMAFEVKHWYDLLRVNQFAILEKFERVKWQWTQSSFFAKCWTVIATVFKVRSINPHTIARRIGTEGKNCKIHPTAVIEACEIGDNVEIGPYAVVRASIIGDGAKIEEHATVNLSVLGPNSRAARYAMINLCVLMEEAFVSRGGGFQMSLYGKGCFIAVDAVMLDLSFGKTIRVLDNDGKRVDSKQHFMGCCIGHRAAIGNAVRLNYGVSVPNDALLVANADELITDASAAEPNVPARVNDRHGVSVLKRKPVD
jgi:acetyltransferase-like isoleucine patch superfamily enzyme